MRDSGRFANATLDALAMATSTQRQQGEELRAMQDTLGELRRQLNENNQDSTRRRPQRNASRQ